MLRDGARIIVDPEQALADVLEIARAHGFDPSRAVGVPELSSELRTVYAAIAPPATADDISAATKLNANRVASALASLELDGLAECVRGLWRRPSV